MCQFRNGETYVSKGSRRTALKFTLYAAAIWLLTVVLLPDWHGCRGATHVQRLRYELRQIEGKSLSRRDLDGALSGMHLAFTTNRYVPDVQYSGPADWAVRLVPDRRTAFANLHAWPYRLLFLEFKTMDYPELAASPQAKGARWRPDEMAGVAP